MNKLDEEIIIESFYKKITGITSTPVDDLIKNRNASKGQNTLVYNEIRGQVEELVKMLNFITPEGLAKLPLFRLMELRQLLNPYIDELDRIKIQLKDPKVPEISQKRAAQELFNSSNRATSFSRNKGEIWNIITEINSLSNSNLISKMDIQPDVEKLKSNINESESYKSQIKAILSNVQDESNKQTVNKHVHIFENEAKKNRTHSQIWLIFIILLIITNLLILKNFLSHIISISNTQDKIEYGLFGTVIISMISYVIMLCSKNYYAKRHNQNVNQHRANCLNSFNTFIDAADEERKQVILMHVTNTIFSHQMSGYLSKETDGGNPNPIFEIVNKIVDTNRSPTRT